MKRQELMQSESGEPLEGQGVTEARLRHTLQQPVERHGFWYVLNVAS